MRMRSGFLSLLAATIGTGLIGCYRPTLPEGQVKVSSGTSSDGAFSATSHIPDNPNANVGNGLFPPAEAPPTLPPPRINSEPIIIPNCTVQYEDRQTVSAEVDGKIDLIATQMKKRPDGIWEYRLPDGTVAATHDPAKFDPKSPHPRIDFNPRDKTAFRDTPASWIPYYKLREGDVVLVDQVLCMLDDSLVSTRKASAAKVKLAASEGQDAAREGVRLTKAKIALYEGKNLGISPQDVLNDQITLTRFVENLAQSLQAIAKAEQDYEEAQVMLAKHWVRSRVNGVIRNVAKRDGEYVRAGEKIFEVQSTQTVRLEGNLDVGYFDQVKRDMAVTVERAVPSAPVKSHAWHRQEIAAVAVTGHSERPMVVSAGMDGVALVWDPNLKGDKNRSATPHALPHPVAVRSVACTPPGIDVVLAVTGADDGKVRVWDLANPDMLPNKPAREPADIHSSGVAAVSISPDGKFAVTAAGREVFIWDLAAGKKMYALPDAHRDSVTSLSFSPQAELVTVSKDRTLKRWKLGKEQAAVAQTIDHRSGAVDILGVSPDGSRVLFDQDKSRIDLLNLQDGRTVGQLTNVGPSVAFSTLALFSHDFAEPNTPPEKFPPYMIVTAGGDGDLKGGLQVWQAPRAGGRGAEVARLITPGRVAVTSAAFSPHKNARFLVVGTAAGTIHLWTPPEGPAPKIEGRITNIDSTDPRYVTVRVEMNNRDVGLLDRSAATVIVNPISNGQ